MRDEQVAVSSGAKRTKSYEGISGRGGGGVVFWEGLERGIAGDQLHNQGTVKGGGEFAAA